MSLTLRNLAGESGSMQDRRASLAGVVRWERAERLSCAGMALEQAHKLKVWDYAFPAGGY